MQALTLTLLPSLSSSIVHTLPYQWPGFDTHSNKIDGAIKLVRESSHLSATCTTEVAAIMKAVDDNRTHEIVKKAEAIAYTHVVALEASATNLSSTPLLVYSPGNLSDIGGAIAALGTPALVIVPSSFHHLYARAFQAKYPNAWYVAPRIVKVKEPLLRVDEWLDHPYGSNIETRPQTQWSPTLKRLLGNTTRIFQYSDQTMELAVLHKPSKTLFTCDIILVNSTSLGGLFPANPSPTLDPLNSIYIKAYITPSVGLFLPIFRTWLSVPPADVNLTKANPELAALVATGLADPDVITRNRYFLNLNEAGFGGGVGVDPSLMLKFMQAFADENQMPFEHVATGHAGIVAASVAREIVRLQTSWLMAAARET